MRLTKRQIANRREWARALETSKQAKNVLWDHETNGYCCLGVACKVLAGIQDERMRDIGTPAGVGVNIRRRAGVVPGWGHEEDLLVFENDQGTPHPTIALYLYLTAEAGEIA